MTIARGSPLQAGAALAGAALTPCVVLAQGASAPAGRASYPFLVKDVPYMQQGGKTRLARIFQPAGTGPFPTILLIHGGAWNNKNRTDDVNLAMYLVNNGFLLAAIDFRNAGEAPYPAALQDINYGIRWLKHHAAEYGGNPARVGLLGTSSGGNLAMLTALRPNDPRYTAIPFPEAPDLDAKVAFVVTGWAVHYPEARKEISERTNNAEMLKDTITFYPTAELMRDGTAALVLEKGEKVATPPALLFQGTDDEWTTPELLQRLAADYRKAGATVEVELFKGEKHTFVENYPNSENAQKALAAIKSFVKKYGSA